MNVYDFDNTIYDGDSTVDFYLYCLKKHPSIVGCLPKQICGYIKYKLKFIRKTEFKEQFYCFFFKPKNIYDDLELLWNLKQKKIKKWYKQNQKADDVVISASPEFLLKVICQREGINYLIASKVNKKTGKYFGENCYGEEKVKRFKEVYKDSSKIEAFYSDSYSDQPMANMSYESYIVKGDVVQKWNRKCK